MSISKFFLIVSSCHLKPVISKPVTRIFAISGWKLIQGYSEASANHNLQPPFCNRMCATRAPSTPKYSLPLQQKRHTRTFLVSKLIRLPQNLYLHLHFLIVSELIIRCCKFSCHAKLTAPRLTLALSNLFQNSFCPNLHLHYSICAN